MHPYDAAFFEEYNQMAKSAIFDIIYYRKIAGGYSDRKTVATGDFFPTIGGVCPDGCEGVCNDEDYGDGGIHPQRGW
jgi:hypothetical protein